MSKTHMAYGCSQTNGRLHGGYHEVSAVKFAELPECQQCKKCSQVAHQRKNVSARKNLRSFAALMSEFSKNIEPA